MMRTSAIPQIGRRDWLKSAGIGTAAAVFGELRAGAEPPPPRSGKVRGVVFMVSDGMSHGVLQLAESFSQLAREGGTGWWRVFNDPAAARGLMDTASANSLVTDSAAASSAWGGGRRVNNGSINVSPEGKAIEPVAAVLKKAKPGMLVGLVTTATVTHATPAGFAASVAKRGDEHEIAQWESRTPIKPPKAGPTADTLRMAAVGMHGCLAPFSCTLPPVPLGTELPAPQGHFPARSNHSVGVFLLRTPLWRGGWTGRDCFPSGPAAGAPHSNPFGSPSVRHFTPPRETHPPRRTLRKSVPASDEIVSPATFFLAFFANKRMFAP